MRKLTCHCEQTFNVDLPETVNLDERAELVGEIADGSFLSCVCPRCGAVLHTEMRTRLDWPSKKTSLDLIPEIDRIPFLSGATAGSPGAEVVIGYPELADRVAVLAAGLDPLVVEALKYHLSVKARESVSAELSEAKPLVFFEKRTASGDLEFHVHGIRKNEIAITVIPFRVYESVAKDAAEHPDGELFASLRNGAYLSVQNILIEDGDQ